MATLEEKHARFDEPLLVRIVEMDPEITEPAVDKKSTRNGFFVLGILATLLVGILAGGPAGRRIPSLMILHCKNLAPKPRARNCLELRRTS